jgi:hypothetical protein
MEISPPDPPGSSPPEFNSIDVDLLPNRESNTRSPNTTFHRFQAVLPDLSSDPINATNSFEFTPIQQTQSRNFPNRKRPNSGDNLGSHIDKEPRTTTSENNPTTALILEARDLLVKAYSTTQNRNTQTRLLDLLEIFREYTENGQIRHTSTILATQVANLEQTARKIELQARQPKVQFQDPRKALIQAPKTATYATVASSPNTTTSRPNSPNSTPQEWTIVSRNKGSSTGASSKGPNSSTRENSKRQEYKNSGPSKLALSRRCTLLQAHRVQASSFSALSIRNLINSAFNKNGIQGLVVSTVSLSIRGNIVVNTTPEFNSEFLLQNETIIKGVFPFLTGLKKGESWYKVAIHGIPIRDFNTEEGMDLIISEIKTFNKGLTPIGRPYWATRKEIRDSGNFPTGTIIVAFPNEDQQRRAINNRLYIAGVSTRVAKFIATPSTAQCNNCSGFGHSILLCKKEPKCILCAENHTISNHYCSICKKKGVKCSHLSIKCTNCLNTTHSANSKLCEVYLAIKNRSTNTLNNEL